MKPDGGVTLAFVMLMVGLFVSGICVICVGSANAQAIEKLEIWVGEEEPYTYEFTIDEPGVLFFEVTEFFGQIQQLGLVLESPSGEIKEVWYGEVGMPLSLMHRISKEDIDKSGEGENDWKISVVNGLGEGKGTLIMKYSKSSEPTTEPLPPIAKVFIKQTEIREGESVSLSGAMSTDSDGYIVSYDWSFGDGSTSKGMIVEHMYPSSGTYAAMLKENVILTVTDDDGLSDSDTVEITINPLKTKPNEPPKAYIDINPNPSDEGDIVKFSGDGGDIDGKVVRCRWTYPNGSTRLANGSSDYFEIEDAEPGWYRFAVRDDGGKWSREASLKLKQGEVPTISWMWISIVMVIAVVAILILAFTIKKI